MNGVRFCPSVQSTFTFRSINFCKIDKPNEKKMLKNSSKLFFIPLSGSIFKSSFSAIPHNCDA